MKLTEKALKTLKDFDLYVKTFINVNNELEIAIATCSNDMVLCDNVWSESELNNLLERWGI